MNSRPETPQVPSPPHPPLVIDGPLHLLESRGFADYRLLDSGNGRKLERFGRVVVDRPEQQAFWRQRLDGKIWNAAHAVFSGDGDEDAGKWRLNGSVPESWPMRVMDVTVLGRLSPFRHLGLFPEQLPHWEWMLDTIAKVRKAEPGNRPRVLNLFGYTGAASLLAARAGAEVVHVDASKKAITWGKENQAASKLVEAPIRWILDDARKFVAREVRRGRTYHVILADPPPRGHGPGGELWEMFEHLPALIADCGRLLATERSAMVLTTYAIRASALAIAQLLAESTAGRAGTIDCGELAIREEQGPRAVPTSLYARWSTLDLAG